MPKSTPREGAGSVGMGDSLLHAPQQLHMQQQQLFPNFGFTSIPLGVDGGQLPFSNVKF